MTTFGQMPDVSDAKAVGDIQRKEVVIENDITWRINAVVRHSDYYYSVPLFRIFI